MQIVYLLLVVGLLGLAVKQMSYILIHGSIFAWLRQGITLRAEKRSWFFIKLKELFTCPLCMTTQASLWSIGIPFVILSLFSSWNQRLFAVVMLWYAEIPLVLFEGFLVSMAFAGLGLWIWDLVDYRPEKFRAERKRCERLVSQQIMIFRESLRSANGSGSILFQIPTPEEFLGIMTFIDRECADIGCASSREICRVRAVGQAVDSWSRDRREEIESSSLVLVEQALGNALCGYYRDRWRYEESSDSDQRAKTYATFRDSLIDFAKGGAS